MPANNPTRVVIERQRSEFDMGFPHNDTRYAPTTRLLNADRNMDDDFGVSPPLYQSVNYSVMSEEHLDEISAPLGSHYYTRRGNPTSARLAKVISEMEGGETGMIFASGMGAI